LHSRLAKEEAKPSGGAATAPAVAAPNTEAYELYLKGHYLWVRRTEQILPKAIAYYQQAVTKDPSYAQAHAELALSYTVAASWSVGTDAENDPKAEAEAKRALELDPANAEALSALSSVAEHRFDWETGERLIRQAIAAHPNDADAHFRYASLVLTP